MKTVLAVSETEIPHTHDLSYLGERLEHAGFAVPAAITDAGWLSVWGVTFRYEDADDLDRDAALKAATAAIGMAEEVLAGRAPR